MLYCCSAKLLGGQSSLLMALVVFPSCLLQVLMAGMLLASCSGWCFWHPMLAFADSDAIQCQGVWISSWQAFDETEFFQVCISNETGSTRNMETGSYDRVPVRGKTVPHSIASVFCSLSVVFPVGNLIVLLAVVKGGQKECVGAPF